MQTTTLRSNLQPGPGATGPVTAWKITPVSWAVIALAAVGCVAAFYPGLRFMVAIWGAVEEYSYGYFIPFVSAFLVWQRSDKLREMNLQGAWSGLALIGAGLLLGLLGDMSAIRTFSQYGFVVAVFGFSACLIGWRGTRVIAMPLAILFFMIPLPQFLLRELSQELQLVSSQIGVWLIRRFDISVFLEGNVIDLGSFKMQVVEACSGLRYLFPLLILGFLAAHFFSGAMWKRVVIVLSTIPLTILTNSLRIALIGVTVEYWGPTMAEGLLHDVEGFFMFMVCMAVLLLEMSLLARLGGAKQSLRTAFGLDYPARIPKDATIGHRNTPRPAVAAALVMAAVAALTILSPAREEIKPQRTAFARFPMALDGGWQGRADRLAPDVLATLAVDDHLIANYTRGGEPWVNFYSAYYDSQSSGASSHSPRTCIPGGGWAMSTITDTEIRTPDGALRVNRAIIQKGEQRQLVYYWFNQRGRSLTDELSVKWFILQDALLRDRTDGALIRLVTPMLPNENETQADRRLSGFLNLVEPKLAAYVPR